MSQALGESGKIHDSQADEAHPRGRLFARRTRVPLKKSSSPTPSSPCASILEAMGVAGNYPCTINEPSITSRPSLLQPQQIEGDSMPPEVGAAIKAPVAGRRCSRMFSKRSREYQLKRLCSIVSDDWRLPEIYLLTPRATAISIPFDPHCRSRLPFPTIRMFLRSPSKDHRHH